MQLDVCDKFALVRLHSMYLTSCDIGCPIPFLVHIISEYSMLHMLEHAATGTRTRVARVRAEYPSQLDYSGYVHDIIRATKPKSRMCARSQEGPTSPTS